MTTFDHRDLGGRSALERLGAELSERDAERETRERLKVARTEARRDAASEALAQLRELMGDLWQRITELAPMTLTFSPHRLELEQGSLEWDVEHDYVSEQAFERSGWDVYAGAWLRLRQEGSVFDYPGCSSSLWFAKLPGELHATWHEVAYDALEGNAPAEEPFALKDLIKADLVASGEPSNLFHALPPTSLDERGRDAFHDRWMGRLAAAAMGDLERPELVLPGSEASVVDHADDVPAADPGQPEPDTRHGSNTMIGRLRGLGT